jgi:hypothetical protein
MGQPEQFTGPEFVQACQSPAVQLANQMLVDEPAQ